MAASWPFSGAITPIGVEIMPNNWPNDIQGALECLAAGGGNGSVETAIAAANLTFPNEYDKVYFLDTSSPVSISRIDTTGRTAGNEITLLVTGNTSSLINNVGAISGSYYPIYVYKSGTGLGNQSVGNGQRLVFTLTQTHWYVTVPGDS